MSSFRKFALIALGLSLAVATSASNSASAQGVLRIGMTASDIPLTHQVAGCDAVLPTRLDHDVLAGAVGEGRQELGRVRQDAVRHGVVEAIAVRAARARRIGAQ